MGNGDAIVDQTGNCAAGAKTGTKVRTKMTRLGLIRQKDHLLTLAAIFPVFAAFDQSHG